jgi:hypothetical protein
VSVSRESTPKSVQTYDVPDAERERIMLESKIEQEWLSAIPVMYLQEELTQAVEAGAALRVPDRGDGFELSPGIPEEFRVLRPEAKVVLDAVVKEWQRRCMEQGLEMKDVYLRITSLARTVEYETYLQSRGYPVVGEGSHTKLMAFDILVSWLEKFAPAHLEILSRILLDLHNVKRVNLINEPTVGVYHVAVNPQYAKG